MKRFLRTLLVIGVLLILLAGGTFATVMHLNSRQRAIPVVFSNNAMLFELWTDYKEKNIEPGSKRTVDRQQKNITTSEGQSYTMLRAVWMDDKQTFDDSYKFAKDNLQRPDKLFAWKYGEVSKGEYGILTKEGGNNIATDGDQDIALALLMAYIRWNDTDYLNEAKPIIDAIYEKSVVTIQGKPVLVANDIERNNQTAVVVNPSYFAPYAYRVFAQVDKKHDWLGLAANSYDLVTRMMDNPLDKENSSGLPPDWVRMDRRTGAFLAPTNGQKTDFSYDAMRVPFRMALDYEWYQDGRAKQILTRFGFLKQFWQNTGLLNAGYTHDGNVTQNYETPSMYGATLGYYKVLEPQMADQIYQNKLVTLYSPDQQAWKAPAPSYYDDNWAWFGMALYLNALPNLTIQN